MFKIRNKPKAASETPRRDTEGVRGLRKRSAETARELYDSNEIEDRLRQRQRSAERADAWADHISDAKS